MIYTLFYSRLRELDPGEDADYAARSAELLGRAQEQHPGFVDIKEFVAADGERLSVVRFRDEESQRSWKLDPVHDDARRKGRRDFYEYYRIAVCEELRTDEWQRVDGGDGE